MDVETSKITQEFKAAGIPVTKSSISKHRSTVTIKTTSSSGSNGNKAFKLVLNLFHFFPL